MVPESLTYRKAQMRIIEFFIAETAFDSVPIVCLSATPCPFLMEGVRTAFTRAASLVRKAARVFAEEVSPHQKRGPVSYEHVLPPPIAVCKDKSEAFLKYVASDVLPYVRSSNDGTRAILYARTPKEVDILSRTLSRLYATDPTVDVYRYTGSKSMSFNERCAAQDGFESSDAAVVLMVANSSFGLGVSVSGVVAVAAFGCPFTGVSRVRKPGLLSEGCM